MNGTQAVTHESLSTHTQVQSNAFVAGEALFEGVGAIATIALSIVGLAGVFPATMAAIAAIVLGAAILLEGGAVEFKNGRLARAMPIQGYETAAAADIQGGIGAIVLGILALLGVAPLTLLCVTLIAVGAAFLFSGRFLSGMAGVVLGILSVAGISSLYLVLVGLLVLGAGLLFAGSEMFARNLAERSTYEAR